MKRKLKKVVYNFIRNDGLRAILALIALLLVLISLTKTDERINLIDWTIFSSIIIAMTLTSISKTLRHKIMAYFEDGAKLTDNYKYLVKKYKEPFVKYNNQGKKDERKIIKKQKELEAEFPIIVDCEIAKCKIVINDSKDMYKIPDIVREKYDELRKAHNSSSVYNDTKVRIDDWKKEGDEFQIWTSRTTYYNSLVTNRAMDYLLSDGTTIREQFEYGPFFNQLKDSKMSNHIGFNGFVESSDGYIPFIKRSSWLSIGKRTYGDSVGASLKSKYALDENGELQLEGLLKGITKEIENELKIPQEYLEEFSPQQHHLIYAYRDLVEGGKPQFLFWTKSVWSKDEIRRNFKQELKKNKGKKDVLIDGKKVVFIRTKDILEASVASNMMICNGKIYRMMPSASACVVMLINYLKEKER